MSSKKKEAPTQNPHAPVDLLGLYTLDQLRELLEFVADAKRDHAPNGAAFGSS